MTTWNVLPREIYEPSADIVARKLLGQLLVRKTPRGWCGGVIVETEAYLRADEAAHSYRGETPRNRVMFGPPGYAYAYFIYGNHWCINAVCGPAGVAEAVLIRALEPTIGLAFMNQQRPVINPQHLTNGPGKLCAAMAIDRTLDGVDLCDMKSPLLIAQNPDEADFLRQNGPVVTTTRVGIRLAASLPLRFYLAANPYVSRRIKTPVAPVALVRNKRLR